MHTLEIDFSGYENFLSFLPLLLLTAFPVFVDLCSYSNECFQLSFYLPVLSLILDLAATGASAIADPTLSLEAS